MSVLHEIVLGEIMYTMIYIAQLLLSVFYMSVILYIN